MRSNRLHGQSGRQSNKVRSEVGQLEKANFQFKSILDSLHDDVVAGVLTMEEAAEELCQANWTPFIDTERTKELLNL